MSQHGSDHDIKDNFTRECACLMFIVINIHERHYRIQWHSDLQNIYEHVQIMVNNFATDQENMSLESREIAMLLDVEYVEKHYFADLRYRHAMEIFCNMNDVITSDNEEEISQCMTRITQVYNMWMEADSYLLEYHEMPMLADEESGILEYQSTMKDDISTLTDDDDEIP